MTVVETDRIEMADESDELTLDMMFEWLERMPVPEGFKVEIVEGTIYMSPQRQKHWVIIAGIFEQLRARYPLTRTASDVRIDFPGHLNGFACDIAAMANGTAPDDKGRWRSQDVEFVGEVISKGTAVNDYGPKKAAYATAEVPVYLIVDPYTAQCHLHLMPKDGKYHVETTLDFGVDVDLTDTPVELKLATDEFPRD
ncbi:Uma2 family endonuclease [Streptomyces synnematoformans]|uniref:Uma2 family endonuclease n=1 Tax=Streptomyces synnematoformans TaxID=415721 RepID=A0ABN2Z0Y0_9ACTN